jgi:hypothetical protein
MEYNRATHFIIFQVGFDAFYFFRIDYQDRDTRKETKELEVVWRGSKTFGSSADVSTIFFSHNVSALDPYDEGLWVSCPDLQRDAPRGS